MKGNIKLIIGILIGIIISGITVFAASQIYAYQVSYENGTVEDALDDLYDLADKYTCEEGSFVFTQSDLTNGHVIADYEPSIFAVYGYNPTNKEFVFYYNKAVDANNFFFISVNNPTPNNKVSIGTAFLINNNLSIKFTASDWINQTIRYTVCK